MTYLARAPGRKPAALMMLAGLVLASLVSAAPLATAQKAAVDPTRLAAARELLALTGASRSVELMMPTMMDQMSKMLISQRPDKRAEIEEVTKAVLEKLLSRRQELIDRIAVIYATRLTDEDIAGITAFFKSPTGRRYVEKQPELMKESMAVGQAWGQSIGREIDATMRQELKKRGIDL